MMMIMCGTHTHPSAVDVQWHRAVTADKEHERCDSILVA